MKTNNGKLLGDANNDSEPAFEEFSRIERNLDDIRQYLDRLEQRYKKLEVLVDIKHREHLQVYQNELKSIQSPVRQIAGRLAALERNKLSRIEMNLKYLEKQIPRKIFWLSFYSSMIFGFISLWNWFELHPLEEITVRQAIAPEERIRDYSP